MQWIDALEDDAWNVVIEELVWHLRNGRVPTVITRRFAPEHGIEFRFKDMPTAFAPMAEPALEPHWREAERIIARFPQLNATCIRSDVRGDAAMPPACHT